MSAIVRVITTEGDEIATSAVDKPVQSLADDIGAAMKAPGSVLTLYASDGVVIVPVRTIRYVRIEEDR